MKKALISVVLAMALLAATVTGALASASGEDDWAYPENVHAFMFRLGIACKAAEIEIPYDPITWVDGDSGYLVLMVGDLALVAMYDLETQQLMSLMFPLSNGSDDARYLVLAALCEEAPVTIGSTLTKDLFLQLGEIVFTQALAGIMEGMRDFDIGAYSFGVQLVGDDDDHLNMIIRAN